MANLIDTHFHLNHYRNYRELAAKISELAQYTICVTNSPGVFLSCKKTIPESKYLKFAIGFHPLDEGLGTTDLRDFLYLLDRTNYVGEIGLDYANSTKMSREAQIHYFEPIVAKCASENKLMTVHIRKAEKDAIEIFRKHTPRKCIIHWFSGSEKQMQEFLDIGCYFSINSNMVISKNNQKYLRIPADRILVESDGPYTKVNGKRYTPELLCQSYMLIADFYGLPNLASIVHSNLRTILETACSSQRVVPTFKTSQNSTETF